MKTKTRRFNSATAMKLLSIILVVLVATDGLITNLLIKSGIAHEGNVFLQPIAGISHFSGDKTGGGVALR